MNVISERYAESLYDLAVEENAIDAYLKDMQLVESVLDSDPDIFAFLTHVLISDDKKCEVIDKGFKDEIDVYVLNFLKLLVRKRRIRYIREIVESFIHLCHTYLGIEEGTVYTAFELNEQQLQKIQDSMSVKENKKVVLKQIVDPTLIGGIKVVMNSRVYDGSIKNRLAMLKHELSRK